MKILGVCYYRPGPRALGRLGASPGCWGDFLGVLSLPRPCRRPDSDLLGSDLLAVDGCALLGPVWPFLAVLLAPVAPLLADCACGFQKDSSILFISLLISAVTILKSSAAAIYFFNLSRPFAPLSTALFSNAVGALP